jgi:hypothetical protein
MFGLKFFFMFLGVCIFGSAAVLVGYDIYVATRLRTILAGARPTNFGDAARARAAFPDHRPKPLWVARFASRKQQS